jgi:hypothetical protein
VQGGATMKKVTTISIFITALLLLACTSKNGQKTGNSIRSETDMESNFIKLVAELNETNVEETIKELDDYKEMVFTQDLDKKIQKIKYFTRLGRSMYKSGGNKLTVFDIIKKNFIFQLVCTMENKVVNLFLYNGMGIPERITYYAFNTRRISTKKLVENVISIGINDRSKSHIVPIKSWMVDFDEMTLREIPVDDLEVLTYSP